MVCGGDSRVMMVVRDMCSREGGVGPEISGGPRHGEFGGDVCSDRFWGQRWLQSLTIVHFLIYTV